MIVAYLHEEPVGPQNWRIEDDEAPAVLEFTGVGLVTWMRVDPGDPFWPDRVRYHLTEPDPIGEAEDGTPIFGYVRAGA